MKTPQPLLPFQVTRGKPCWAAFGKLRWSAVVITDAKRRWATANRVNPATNEVTKRGAKVQINHLLTRDPSQEGADKPTQPPKDIFVEPEKKEVIPTVKDTTTASKPDIIVRKDRKISPEDITKILSYLKDDSTTDDW